MHFLFLVGFCAEWADPILNQFHGPKCWVGGPIFGSILWTTKLGHTFMILRTFNKEPKTMFQIWVREMDLKMGREGAKMGPQSGPERGPQKPLQKRVAP